MAVKVENRIDEAITGLPPYASLEMLAAKTNVGDVCNQMFAHGYVYVFAFVQGNGLLLTLLFRRQDLR